MLPVSSLVVMDILTFLSNSEFALRELSGMNITTFLGKERLEGNV